MKKQRDLNRDDYREIPLCQRETAKPDLDLTLCQCRSKEARNKAIYAAHIIHRYTLQQIEDYVFFFLEP